MSFIHISEHAREASKHMEGRMKGTIKSIPTPWKKYNEVGVDGIEFNSITLIGAMSGSGKTVASNQIVAESFDLDPTLDHMALDFNFEMVGRNLVMRNVSANLGYTMRNLNSVSEERLQQEELDSINRYISEVLCKKPIYIEDNPKGVVEIKNMVYEFYNKFRKKFICSLDHTILTKKTINENSTLETLYNLGEMCTETKKQVPIAWIVLTQLNRSIEEHDRTKKTAGGAMFPMKADIFGGDALYQHSDMVTILHRPWGLAIREYGPAKIPVDKNSLFFHCLKVRNGAPTQFEMKADFANMRIIDKDIDGMTEPIVAPKTILTTRNI